ncbi:MULTISPECIES: molybdate ABC transporter substrate-binding protein [unclassified Marinobacterium]|jgi:molybdate transport system substrate-binding protein|uniref:molybdate ABC transporter substrate-binding protein n=1 Tax=unclassified Marinobacterium TaxID=2644139 RepID=UPI00156A4404|nr:MULTISPECIES: molybdate ABC transporter substrate-binding protein [unclassified Marinobacterium]NRP10904.1 Molybdate-binding periplasmic protein precursor [Marinobacterium sp. xm-g-48]NRP14815.1 Molybdate-binding periplasmic protein precursor [Marinobacterium sp. xm-a-152]NRP27298.1 Molybdate-binding periplasmic protein precursor [Marinobacterium sp. xm-d-420]NRP36826.1 Molybdate-binding periplasmic protein precursor [Marinobacterium sp. xm-d-579]NRP38547.1 Molybdate-binding periplasmic pro
MQFKAVLLRSILTLSLAAFASSQAVANTLTVFAAASLKNAIDEITEHYEADHSDSIVVSYAGSATLARQIEMGAPADIFISANTAWMDYLSDRALINEPTRFNLASNQLVLISHTPDAKLTLTRSQELLDWLDNEYLAMGLVESVPAGIYGKQALTYFDLWDPLKQQVAQSDNVRSALALVASGEAPLGIVYHSDAVAEPKVSIAATFPTESHDRILYPVAAVTESDKSTAAFLEFLRSEQSRAILERNGFLMDSQQRD